MHMHYPLTDTRSNMSTSALANRRAILAVITRHLTIVSSKQNYDSFGTNVTDACWQRFIPSHEECRSLGRTIMCQPITSVTVASDFIISPPWVVCRHETNGQSAPSCRSRVIRSARHPFSPCISSFVVRRRHSTIFCATVCYAVSSQIPCASSFQCTQISNGAHSTIFPSYRVVRVDHLYTGTPHTTNAPIRSRPRPIYVALPIGRSSIATTAACGYNSSAMAVASQLQRTDHQR
jgi:hypothetical protein